MKQRIPTDLAAVITATLEMECYLSHKAVVSNVKEEESTNIGQIGAVSVSNDKLVTLVEKPIIRIENLEVGGQKVLVNSSHEGDDKKMVGKARLEKEWNQYSYLKRYHMLELWQKGTYCLVLKII